MKTKLRCKGLKYFHGTSNDEKYQYQFQAIDSASTDDLFIDSVNPFEYKVGCEYEIKLKLINYIEGKKK